MLKIIGIGNALVDVLVQLSDQNTLQTLGLPKGGMTLIDAQKQSQMDTLMQSLSPSRSSGGSACNAMLALAGLGACPGYIGSIGQDADGDFFMTACNTIGIDVRAIRQQEHTGIANTFITPDGERTFATFLGAASLMGADDITPSLFEGYDILHIEGYLVQNHQLIETICTIAHGMGMRLSIDLGSYNIVRAERDFFHHLVSEYIDIVFANEEESEAYTGCSDPVQALAMIAQDCQIAVVKLGCRGASAMMHGGERVVIPARRVNVIDTTAAGDFFAGGFLYAFSQQHSLEDCLKKGALLSENVIQIVGTHLSEEQWEAIHNA